MKLTKEQQIEEYLKLPIQAGDTIIVLGENSRNPLQESWELVEKIDDQFVYFKKYNYSELQKRKIGDVRKNTVHIGCDPFQPELKMTAHQTDIEQLFWKAGFDKSTRSERMEQYFKVPIPELCTNPIVIDEHGNDVEYQRGLVWSLEQKQLLIESIYNNIEIGKFVFRKRSFYWVENRVKQNKIEHTAFADIVDGKQRLNAIKEFYENKFRDVHGNLFTDLSGNAQRKFTNYRNLSCVELDENSQDKDVLRTFLSINFTGTPMSMDHINYVKSIKV